MIPMEHMVKTIALKKIIKDVILFDIQSCKERNEFVSTLTTTSTLIKISILSWIYSDNNDTDLKIKTNSQTYQIQSLNAYSKIWNILDTIRRISVDASFDDNIRINNKRIIDKEDITKSINSWWNEVVPNDYVLSEKVYDRFIYSKIKDYLNIK